MTLERFLQRMTIAGVRKFTITTKPVTDGAMSIHFAPEGYPDEVRTFVADDDGIFVEPGTPVVMSHPS